MSNFCCTSTVKSKCIACAKLLKKLLHKTSFKIRLWKKIQFKSHLEIIVANHFSHSRAAHLNVCDQSFTFLIIILKDPVSKFIEMVVSSC